MNVLKSVLASGLMLFTLKTLAEVPADCIGEGARYSGANLVAAYEGNSAYIFASFARNGQFCANLKIPVVVKRSECAGTQNLAFAAGNSDLVSGRFSQIEGLQIKDLFGSFQGKASGAGLFAGGAKWQAVSANRVALSNKRIAIPLPIGGGDIALGVTSCNYSFEIQPEGAVTLYNRNANPDLREQVLNFDQVANWSF